MRLISLVVGCLLFAGCNNATKQFEDLAELCQEDNRWSFLCVIAPLRLPAATGSPVNPIGIL